MSKSLVTRVNQYTQQCISATNNQDANADIGVPFSLTRKKVKVSTILRFTLGSTSRAAIYEPTLDYNMTQLFPSFLHAELDEQNLDG